MYEYRMGRVVLCRILLLHAVWLTLSISLPLTFLISPTTSRPLCHGFFPLPSSTPSPSYFWFRHCNMGLLLVLVSTQVSMQALPSDTADEKARTDLGRSCIQTAIVFVYLIAIIACRPYVCDGGDVEC